MQIYITGSEKTLKSIQSGVIRPRSNRDIVGVIIEYQGY